MQKQIINIDNNDEYSGKRYILKVDLDLPETVEINKCNKHGFNCYDKKKTVIHIRALRASIK